MTEATIQSHRCSECGRFTRPSAVEDELARILADGEYTTPELAAVSGRGVNTVRMALHRMKDRGLTEPLGTWEPKKRQPQRWRLTDAEV